MASNKTDTAVIIDGKVYTLMGYESPDYIQRIATYLNGKISEFSKMKGYDRLTQDYKNVLLQINIADDYFRTLEELEKTKSELADRDRQLYDVKHDFVAKKIQFEDSDKKVQELQEQIQKDQIRITALETERKTREEDAKGNFRKPQ